MQGKLVGYVIKLCHPAAGLIKWKWATPTVFGSVVPSVLHRPEPLESHNLGDEERAGQGCCTLLLSGRWCSCIFHHEGSGGFGFRPYTPPKAPRQELATPLEAGAAAPDILMRQSCPFLYKKSSQDFHREGLHPCHPHSECNSGYSELYQAERSSPARKPHSRSWIDGTEHLEEQLTKKGLSPPLISSTHLCPSEGLISPTIMFFGKIQFTPWVNDTMEREGALRSLPLLLSEQKIAKLTGI